MIPRKLSLVLLLACLVAVAALAACGSGDSNNAQPGKLTDPRDVATATPWTSPPPIVILDPNALPTLAPEGENPGSSGSPTATPAPGSCGDTYTVVAGDSPSLIAQKCGVTTDALLQANPGLDPKALHAGDKINIPKAGQ